MLDKFDRNVNFREMTPENLIGSCAEILKKCTELHNDIVDCEEVNVQTVLKPLIESDNLMSNQKHLVTLIKNVAVSKELRSAASDSYQQLEKASLELSTRLEVFEKLLEINKRERLDLKKQYKRFLQNKIREGKRNGLHLDADSRAQLKEIKERLSKLSSDFLKNYNEENTLVYFKPHELEGVPESFLNSLKVLNGELEVTLKYPHYTPIANNCRIPETREKLEKAFGSRCPENIPLLEEALKLRQKEAEILDYPNHAAYIQEVLMAKNPQTVSSFLDNLVEKFLPLWEEEKLELLNLKKAECDKLGIKFDGQLNACDFQYYSSRLEEVKFQLDKEALKDYFPLNAVTDGLLKIYETLLSLKITQIQDACVWNDDVACYKVEDNSAQELLGYFYMDLHPREGKYGYYACMPIQHGCRHEKDNTRIPHVVAMVCNFSPPQDDRPSLLSHEEVTSFFHEFGHIMHRMCTDTELPIFAGPCAVETDFVECPSQMLENWVWFPETLSMMSCHYKTGEKIPQDLLDKLITSRFANISRRNLQTIVLSKFDQEIHTRKCADVTKLYATRVKEVFGIDVIPGRHLPATFIHMMCGYSARYYSYEWSEVYSADMFETRFGKDKLLCYDAGKAYRDLILRPGGAEDADNLLRNFLGRDPRVEPFFKSKGFII